MAAMCVWMQATLAAAVGAVPLPASFAQPSWGYFIEGDEGFSNMSHHGEMEVAMAEARIGDASMHGAWEHAIWPRGAASPQVEGQYHWTSGSAVPFTIDYDASGTLEYTVGDQTMKWAGLTDSFTDIFLRTSSAAGTSVRISELELVGAWLPLGDLSSSGDDDVNYLRISNGGTGIGSFTLNGTQYFSWEGDAPGDEAMSFQMMLTNVMPEPASLAMLAGVAALVRRRRGR